MKYIQLGIHLTDDLGMKSVIIMANDTELKCDSELLKKISITLLKSIFLNDESVKLQDLLNEIGITLSKN